MTDRDRDPFDLIVTTVLAQEGEHSPPRPDDPGGDTWWGIARRSHPDEAPWPPTKERAIELYRTLYWTEPRIYLLPGPLALCVFDAAVNQGPVTAIKLLQIALEVSPDGVIGPQTLDAVRARVSSAFLARYLSARAVRYSDAPNWSSWRYGWMMRLFAIHRTALAMLSQGDG